MPFWGSAYEHSGIKSLPRIRQQTEDGAKKKPPPPAFWALPLATCPHVVWEYLLNLLTTGILHSSHTDYYFIVPAKLLTKARFVVQI